MFPACLYRVRQDFDAWTATTTPLALLILLPLAAVIVGLGVPGPEWGHIAETVLGSYIFNTVLLIFAGSFLALLFAVPTAWLVAVFDFPGRRVFEWALVLPLAIPTYVAAFTYVSIPEAAIPLLVAIREQFGVTAFQAAESALRYGLLSVLLAGVLYPYIYLSARASFSRQQRSVIEAAQVLGRPSGTVFRTIALPLARPAIVAGLSLVIMEIVNDYGAVHFFGVPTLTEGIFRTWFGLGDRVSAVRLAGIVMLCVLAFIWLESLQRGRARYVEDVGSESPLSRRHLRGRNGILASLTCLLPLSIGFLYPVGTLLRWSLSLDELGLRRSWSHLGQSLLLAFITAAAITGLALLFAYARKLHPTRWYRTLIRFATAGYAVPGAVVALGVMVCLGLLDNFFAWTRAHTGIPDFYLSGSLFAIFSAYIVRFLAVAFQPAKAGLERICGSMDEASRVLGKSPASTLWRINLPLLRGTLLGALMLVFVDILKELPLTLILRPANFDTLATIAFGMATEGQIHDSAVPSLMIVATGAVGLMILNRFMNGDQK